MSKSTSIEARVEEYVQGLRCPACHEAVEADGCRCSRERLYQDRAEEVNDWYDSLPAHVKDDKSFSAMASVRSTLSRERRRAGFRDMPTQPITDHVGGAFGGVTVATDERLGLYREHSVATKWFKPTERRTRRADYEPI